MPKSTSGDGPGGIKLKKRAIILEVAESSPTRNIQQGCKLIIK
jgi:hypothetical protein